MYKFYYAQIANRLAQYDVGKEYTILYVVGESQQEYKIKVTIVTGTLIWADIIE